MKNIFYDEIKDFKRLKPCTQKTELAISRLENPYKLTDIQLEMYVDYLKNDAEKTVKEFIDTNNLKMVEYLSKYKVLKKSNIVHFIDYARENKKIDMLSLLMEASNLIRKGSVSFTTLKNNIKSEISEFYNEEKYKNVKEKDIIWIGEEPMPWLVLENIDGKLLLLSAYALDCQPFESFYTSKSWYKSTIQMKLNNEYIYYILSQEEIGKIIPVYIDEFDKLYFESKDNTTLNNMFFLSIDETEKYLKNKESRMAVVTEYATRSNLWTIFDQYAYWWLRNSGENGYDKYYVKDGEIDYKNSTVEVWNYQHFGIRPAMYIKF